MSSITQITLELSTAAESPANMDGWVYLGIAGREFGIDANRNDFEPGDTFTYVLGEGSNVLNPNGNDPRNPALDTDDLDRYPAYLRFKASDNESAESWLVERITVTVNPDSDFPARFDNLRLEGAPKIWLGRATGHQVGLRRV